MVIIWGWVFLMSEVTVYVQEHCSVQMLLLKENLNRLDEKPTLREVEPAVSNTPLVRRHASPVLVSQKVVLQKSIPTQPRQLILYISNSGG